MTWDDWDREPQPGMISPEDAVAIQGRFVELLMRLKAALDDPGQPCGVGMAEVDILWAQALEVTRREVGLEHVHLAIFRDLLRASRDAWRLRLIATEDMPDLRDELRAAWARGGRPPGPYDPAGDDVGAPAREGYHAEDWTWSGVHDRPHLVETLEVRPGVFRTRIEAGPRQGETWWESDVDAAEARHYSVLEDAST